MKKSCGELCVLAMLILLIGGCSISEGTIRFVADPQSEHALSIDLVSVYDEALLSLLYEDDAAHWFVERQNYCRAFADEIDIWQFEVVPGYPINFNISPRRDLLALFAFVEHPTSPAKFYLGTRNTHSISLSDDLMTVSYEFPSDVSNSLWMGGNPCSGSHEFEKPAHWSDSYDRLAGRVAMLEIQQKNLRQNTPAKKLDPPYASNETDNIRIEYEKVVQAYKERLQGYYPFNLSEPARELPPAGLRFFLNIYPGEKSGLAERLSLFSHEDSAFKDAHGFVESLDEALNFLSVVIAAEGEPAIEIDPEFNVLLDDREDLEFTRHIFKWELKVGGVQLNYPGNASSLYWLTRMADSTKLSLNWAAGSPFIVEPISGTRGGSHVLVYESKGFWSLLKFIQTNRSGLYDSQALFQESVLLEFRARMIPKSNSTSPIEGRGLLRLTLSGIDPDTKEVVRLDIPRSFPSEPPTIGQRVPVVQGLK